MIFCINVINVIIFNSMGSWHMNLSDYMGGRCLRKCGNLIIWVSG